MRMILVMMFMAPCVAAAAPRAEYLPLAFLAGHCWKGEFPGGAKTTDEHCFTWIYDGKFLRDQYRSRWQPSGANAYDVLTEFKVNDGWVPGFKVHMEMKQ